MSVQIFLQGRLLGIEEFLRASSGSPSAFTGRSRWVGLLSEVLPRGLLAEFGLSPLLLGHAGGGQFFLQMPGEFLGRVEGILQAARTQVDRLSGGKLRLAWTSTEDLGEWPIVRKRLNDQFADLLAAPLVAPGADFFAPFDPAPSGDADEAYFVSNLVHALDTATHVSWSAAEPARVLPGTIGTHAWSLDAEGIPFARHRVDFAPGARLGMLLGDVDGFGARLRRATTIEEHLHTAATYKDFFAGELRVGLMSLPDVADRVTLLYSGGDDFAVFGHWHSLILVARQLQRVFKIHSDTNLKDAPGAEGKTITMALAVAPEASTAITDLYTAARENLRVAKTGPKDSCFLFGRSLEWKHLDDAEELRTLMLQLVDEFDCSPQFLAELRTFYREGSHAAIRRRATRFDRPWRFHRRLQRTLEPTVKSRRKEREFEKMTRTVIREFIGKQAGQTRLRPSGRVALEWAQLTLSDRT